MLATLACALSGCGNNPYPAREQDTALCYKVLRNDPRTLDPAVVYNVADTDVTLGIYGTYLQYHYLKRDPFVLQPALGAEMPQRESLPKGEKWTFRIKKGLRFQDDPCFPGGKGREILASDFLFAFKRMADPSVNCPILGFLLDKIVGLEEFVARQRALAKQQKPSDLSLPVAGLQADPKDPYTFRIVLSQPYPQLRYLMAMAFTAPMAPEAIARYGKGIGKHPVGCGPYRIAEWQPKHRIVLRRNPNYRQDDFYPTEGMPGDREKGLLEDAGKQLPLNDGIVYSMVREGLTAWNFFEQGYLDVFGVTQENFSRVVSQVGTISPEMAAKGIRLESTISLNIDYFIFNLKDPVVGGYGERQKKLRQALSLCYDAQAELNLFNAGLGKQAQWLVPPGVFSYEPDYRNPYRQYDVGRAKQLLAEAGYPDGVARDTGDRLTIIYDNAATTPAARQAVEFLRKQFSEIGVRLESRSWQVDAWNDRLDKGQFQLTSYGWVADYPDPENFVFLLWGPNLRPGPNYTAYDRPEYNRLFEQMRAMDDTPERAAVIRKMRDMAVEDCPYIFASHSEDLRLLSPWVHSDKSHPIALDTLKYRRIDGGLRARRREEWNRPNYWPLVLLGVLLGLGSAPAVAVFRRRARQSARARGKQWSHT